MKVATIVGTRPELIKLSRVIAELDARCDHLLMHTGQNYDYSLNQVFFEQSVVHVVTGIAFVTSQIESPVDIDRKIGVDLDQALELDSTYLMK